MEGLIDIESCLAIAQREDIGLSLLGLKISDLVSLGVAFLAIVVATWNAHVDRSHNKLSVRPLLVPDRRYRGAGDYYGTRIFNRGVGPALLQNLTLFLDGEKVVDTHRDWSRALKEVGLNIEDGWIIARTPKMTVEPGQSIRLLEAKSPPLEPNKMIIALTRLSISVTYKSLYNELQPELSFQLTEFEQII